MCYVYILYSAGLDLYYIGSSENPELRLAKHLSRHKGFTSKASDWKIMYTEAFEDKAGALARQRQLKSWKNRARLESLIKRSS